MTAAVTAHKWATVRRYRDGLIDPSVRDVVMDRGIEWVTDRFTLVRSDMFSIPVTGRGYLSGEIKPSMIRKILNKRPATGKAVYANQSEVLGLVGDEEESAILVVSGFGHSVASLCQPCLSPLLQACDVLRLNKDGTLYGYQRRPRAAAPVLVAVIQPRRWSKHYLKDAS